MNLSKEKNKSFMRISFMVCLLILVFISCIFIYALISSIFGTDDFTGWEKMIFAHRDSFYVGGGTSYDNHLPLVKPYYVEQPKDANAWLIVLRHNPDNLKGKPTSFYSQINDVGKIAIEKNVIMVYSSFTQPPDMAIHWFIIIPSRDIETGFEKETDFQTYIQKLGIQNPRWITPDDAIHQFWKTECLYWIPDCQK